MKKLKISVLTLGAAGLLVLFAFLPSFISSVLDIRLGDHISYSDMTSIQLDVGGGQSDNSIMEKLAFLSVAETANTTPDQMTMHDNQVMEAVDAFLQQLETAGVYQWVEPTKTSVQPKLLYDLSDPSRHLLVWSVSMIYKQSPSQVMMLDVDDATGKILSFSYSIYKEYEMDGVWERNKAVADIVTDIYFAHLGLEDYARAAEGSQSVNGEEVYESKEVDGGVTEVIYSFESQSFGVIHAHFTVDGAGSFHLTFLN